jgi:hypothetical protein
MGIIGLNKLAPDLVARDFRGPYKPKEESTKSQRI